jgi:uncharacterized protein YndB with AHSA1/START domain
MHYEQTVAIDATPEAVWAVIADVEKWPEWTASIRSVELLTPGPLAVGSRARVRQPRLPTAVWEVTELVPGRSFTWVNRSPGMTSTGVHGVTGGGPASVATLRIEQTGPLSVLALPFLPLTKKYVQLEAAGLKRRSEAGG